MKIALVHEFLTQFGGAEKVLLDLFEIWPEAELYVLVNDPEKVNHVFDKFKIKESFIGSLPFAKSHHKLYLMLMPFGIEHFDFTGYDLVFSDSSSFAKGANAKGLHICYCHTPTRFLWTDPDYLSYQKYPFVLKWFGKLLLPFVRNWDHMAAQRPNFILANSKNVQDRIKKFYGRDSEIIPPPIDTDFYHPTLAKQDYYLVAGRLEPYKKVDVIIRAFNQLNLPLKIAGTGTVLGGLKKIAGPNIEFLGRVSDEKLRDLYSGAKAFIFAAEEDAGITLLEAQACGTPVLALGKGGALETVVPGITGEFFNEQSAEAIIEAVRKFDPAKYDVNTIRQNALKYDKKIFQKKIKEFVESKL